MCLLFFFWKVFEFFQITVSALGHSWGSSLNIGDRLERAFLHHYCTKRRDCTQTAFELFFGVSFTIKTNLRIHEKLDTLLQ